MKIKKIGKKSVEDEQECGMMTKIKTMKAMK